MVSNDHVVYWKEEIDINDTRRCANEDVGLRKGVNYEISHQLERGTKHFFKRAWKPLPNRHVLKKWKLDRENPNRTISASKGFGLLQMVSESDTEGCAARRLSFDPKGVDTRQCASKDAEPRKGVDWESHIDWRREQVPTRTLSSEGDGL